MLRYAASSGSCPTCARTTRRDRQPAARASRASTCRPGRAARRRAAWRTCCPPAATSTRVDPHTIPSATAWEVGAEPGRARCSSKYLAEDEAAIPRASASSSGARRRCARTATTSPRSSPCSACGRSGSTESRRVSGVEVIPLAELGRPRDRRDGADQRLLPRRLPEPGRTCSTRRCDCVARLDEPVDQNFVAAHVRARRAALARRALAPEAAGAGRAVPRLRLEAGHLRRGHPAADRRAQLADRRRTSPTSTSPGAAMPTRATSTARRRRASSTSGFARSRSPCKNQDNREHDIFDSDDYFQFHGGMIATIRALTGAEPAAYFGDSADPDRVRGARPGRRGAARVPHAGGQPEVDRQRSSATATRARSSWPPRSTTCSATTPRPRWSTTGCTSG